VGQRKEGGDGKGDGRVVIEMEEERERTEELATESYSMPSALSPGCLDSFRDS
jgi:hypothetical protein